MRAAADPDPDATHRRLRAARRLRRYTDGEGGWNLTARGTPADGAAFNAVLDPLIDAIFRAARATGEHAPFEAHAFDALMALADLAADHPGDPDLPDHRGDPDEPSDPGHAGDADDHGAPGVPDSTDGPGGPGPTCGPGGPVTATPATAAAAAGPVPSRIRCRARPRSLRPRSLRPPTHQHRPAIPPTPTSRTTTTQSRPVAGPTPKRSSARPPSHHLTDRASRPPRPHPRRPLPPTRRPPYPRRWVRQTPRRRPQRARRTSYLADGGGPTALPGAAPGRPHRPAPRPGHRDELCEIAGVGPIPITIARDLLGDAVLKLVITRGVDVLHVTHLGRGPTAAQRIALAWTSPHCSVLGCPRTRVQIDHRLDWAHTRHTRLDELDPLRPTTTT